VEWINFAQDRDYLRTLLSTEMNIWTPQKYRNCSVATHRMEAGTERGGKEAAGIDNYGAGVASAAADRSTYSISPLQVK
jgi:hypothetical protein